MKKKKRTEKYTKIFWLTGYISVISSPSGFSNSRILQAQTDLKSGSMAQKNLKITSQPYQDKWGLQVG